MLPRIVDDPIGFHWATPEGRATRLADLLDLPDADPGRWLPTHLEALDDHLIAMAARFGEVMGGGRRPESAEFDDLNAGYRVIDRGCVEYADASTRAGLTIDTRAGQIVGTAALMSILLRRPLGLVGPPPFTGELADPAPGAVAGTAGLTWYDEQRPWAGARWLVTTTAGQRLPATLGMLLFDSSGTNKDAARDEHRQALARLADEVSGPAVDPLVAAGAIDWLLLDWLVAHRDGPDSGAVECTTPADAAMIVTAAAASGRLRARFDPGLLDLPR